MTSGSWSTHARCRASRVSFVEVLLSLGILAMMLVAVGWTLNVGLYEVGARVERLLGRFHI